MKSKEIMPPDKRLNGAEYIGHGKFAYYPLFDNLKNCHRALLEAERELKALGKKEVSSLKDLPIANRVKGGTWLRKFSYDSMKALIAKIHSYEAALKGVEKDIEGLK